MKRRHVVAAALVAAVMALAVMAAAAFEHVEKVGSEQTFKDSSR